jgi:hypothetical protein
MYKFGSYNLEELIHYIKLKWGNNVDFDKVHISTEYIQIKCFSYDLYDSSDYATFIVIEYVK